MKDLTWTIRISHPRNIAARQYEITDNGQLTLCYQGHLCNLFDIYNADIGLKNFHLNYSVKIEERK